MTSQNNELRSQNAELHSQVNRYRMEVNRLERKLEKHRKKADMSDLITRLADRSVVPWSPSVSRITHGMAALSTSERTPPQGFSSPQVLPPIPVVDPVSQFLAPTMGEGVTQGVFQGGVTRFCSDGTEIWYPGNEMPADYQLNVLNSTWSPLDNCLTLSPLENDNVAF